MVKKRMALTKKPIRPRDGYWFSCIRRAFGIRQGDVAYYARVSDATVSNFETGKNIVDQLIKNSMHAALVDLIIDKVAVYGPEKSKALINIAKLDFCQYFGDYECFVIGCWSSDNDDNYLTDALSWSGNTKDGDIV